MATSSTSTSTSWTTVHDLLRGDDRRTIETFRRTKWKQVCRVASEAKLLECVALDQVACGLNNMVRLPQFSDGTRWAARIHIKRTASPQSRAKLNNEVATMQFIKQHSKLPVPRVFAFDADHGNAVGAAFMLIELLPGTVAMDALGGYEVHRGVIPSQYRQTFYRSVAECHVQVTSLRLPKIGTIVRNRDGGYDSGPLPGIGGPFDTAAAFFEAWADSVRFKWDEKAITSMMQRSPIPANKMITIVDDFPSQIKCG